MAPGQARLYSFFALLYFDYLMERIGGRSMRATLMFPVFAFLVFSAFSVVPAAEAFDPSESTLADSASVESVTGATPTTASAASEAESVAPASEKARHFSIHYNILRSSFEGRYIPNDRWYIAFVPLIIGGGSKDSASEGAFFPNVHFDQAYSAYAYVSLLEPNPVTRVAARGGLETRGSSHLFYFAEMGLRLRILPFDHWAFELSSYPVQVSYQTEREVRDITLFQSSNMNMGLEFLF
jgi:hypothetical protein